MNRDMITRDSRTGPGRRQIPPYSSFVAFESLVRRAGSEGLPLQVNKSLLIEWGIAAGNESGLITTLKALGLVDDDGRPTDVYREIRLSQPRRTAALRRAVDRAYPGLAASGSLPDDDQLYDYFVEQRGLTGQMVDKAIRFYRQLMDSLAHPAASTDTEGLKRTTTPIRLAAPRLTDSGAEARLASANPGGNIVALPFTRDASRVEPADVGLTLVVQIRPEATEDELTDFFRSIRRAWRRSQMGAENEGR